MSYRFLDHTADVGAELEAGSLGELLAEALAAFTDTVTERRRVEPAASRRFTLEADDAETLLVDWLGEALYVYEVEDLLLRDAEVEVEEAAGGALRLAATARGETYDPERHPIKVLIKGITYHGLEVVEGADGRWRAQVIFDI
jgi:SHS2 domain-containing protein